MAFYYPYGPALLPHTLIRKERVLPGKGVVAVEQGQLVQAGDVIVRTQAPRSPCLVNIAAQLGVIPGDAQKYLRKRDGESVKGDEALAERSRFLASKLRCLSPLDGTVGSFNAATGELIIHPITAAVELRTPVPGRVVEVVEQRGAIIETPALLLQGILGLGGEVTGRLAVLPGETLPSLGKELREAVIVVMAPLSLKFIQAAAEHGVRGIIAGSIEYSVLHALVPDTLTNLLNGGTPAPSHGVQFPTLLFTEGMGTHALNTIVRAALERHEGKEVALQGAINVRTNLRPELLIPLSEAEAEAATPPTLGSQVLPQARVRLNSGSSAGALGEVVSLLPYPMTFESGVRGSAVEVRLDNGDLVYMPRTNVEQVI